MSTTSASPPAPPPVLPPPPPPNLLWEQPAGVRTELVPGRSWLCHSSSAALCPCHPSLPSPHGCLLAPWGVWLSVVCTHCITVPGSLPIGLIGTLT